jgi:hypothetical protein
MGLVYESQSGQALTCAHVADRLSFGWRWGFVGAALFGFVGVALAGLFYRTRAQSEGLLSITEWAEGSE